MATKNAKTVKKTAEKKSEVYFYYLRNEDNTPYGCVAITRKANGKVNRGVSLCSANDNWNRTRARNIAKARVIEAGRHNLSIPFGTYNGSKPTAMPTSTFKYKLQSNAVPTQAETEMLSKPQTTTKTTTKKTPTVKSTAKKTAKRIVK